MSGILSRIRAWAGGDTTPVDERVIEDDPSGVPADPEPVRYRLQTPRELKHSRAYRRVYGIFAVAFCMVLILLLLITVSWLPRLGDAASPGENEVVRRYVEKGLDETGAVNIVSGIILDYRAFDTFGESCVLFTAVSAVFILLKHANGKSDPDDRLFEPRNDRILQTAARFLVPFGIILGAYVLLTGHLGPGGGFSGGAILGAVLILYTVAFGTAASQRFFSEKTFRTVTTAALCFYCLAKGYSFFTGANGLESGIPLGKAGAILSSGLILPLNVAVGLVVACTMYGFYCVFRRGNL